MNKAAFSNHPRLLYYAHDEVLAWAKVKLQTNFPEPCFALGVLDGQGRLIGAVIYNDYGDKNVEMSIYGPRRVFYKNVSREIFAYAFDHLGVERISLTIRESSPEVIRAAQKWGWVIEGRKRNFYGEGHHAVILGLLRAECRFL